VKRNLSMFMAVLMVFSAVIGGFTGAAYADSHENEAQRIEGENRYETAHEIAKISNPNPETVILVRGDGPAEQANVVDGLTASGLAGTENAPILLVQQNRIPTQTMTALEELDPQNVIIVGGENAVSDEVHDELVGMGLEIERISGENRYETAAEIAIQMGSATENTAVITNGNDENLVDSLTAGPLAKMGHPILLINNSRNHIPTTTIETIEALGITNLIIVGGNAAVSTEVEAALNAIEGVNVSVRLAGENRYETSVEVSEFTLFKDMEEVYLVNGASFVDAVAASTLGKAIVYVNGARNDIPEMVGGLLSRKAGCTAIGGNAAISANLSKDAMAAVIGQTIFNRTGTYGPEEGSQVIDKDVMINVEDVILQNLVITGDLLIAEEVGYGDVTLNNVIVEGDTIIRGGGTDSIYINGGSYRSITVEQTSSGAVRIMATDIEGLEVMISEDAAGQRVELEGNFEKVTVASSNIEVETKGETNINTIEVPDTSENVTIKTSETTKVTTLTGNNTTKVEGSGEIEETEGDVEVEEDVITPTPAPTPMPTPTPDPEPTPDPVEVSGLSVENASTITFNCSVEGAIIKWNGVVLPEKTINGVNIISVPLMESEVDNTLTIEKSGYSSFFIDDMAWLAPYDANVILDDWAKDRQEPKSWEITGDRIAITTGEQHPSNPWYDWQGKKAPTNMPLTSDWVMETELEITEEMLSQEEVATSIWLQVEGKENFNIGQQGVIDWSILHFKNGPDSADSGWFSWDSQLAEWKKVGSIEVGTHKLTIIYEQGMLYQYINGALVNAYDINTEVGLSAPSHMIIQAYTYGEEYSVNWKVPSTKYYELFDSETIFISNEKQLIGAADNQKDGQTWFITQDIEVSSKISIRKSITINGDDATIKANNADWGDENHNKQLIGIYSDNVTIENIVLDSNHQAFGLQFYTVTDGNLENVTLRNSKGAGLTVNGAMVTANNLNTNDNSWGAVNVDPGVGVESHSIFSLKGTGILGENNQIWSDQANVNGATVSVIAEDYKEYQIVGTTYRIWKNEVPKNAAIIDAGETAMMYLNIQSAVDAASVEDTILIGAGTYDGFRVNKDRLTIEAIGEVVIKPVEFSGWNAGILLGVLVESEGVAIDGIVVDGNALQGNVQGISGFETADFTVRNSEFINLQIGINANSNAPSTEKIVNLETTDNLFASKIGIGGTENTIITANGNKFNTTMEAVGLGEGVATIDNGDVDVVAYLYSEATSNNFGEVVKGDFVVDYRDGVKKYDKDGNLIN